MGHRYKQEMHVKGRISLAFRSSSRARLMVLVASLGQVDVFADHSLYFLVGSRLQL